MFSNILCDTCLTVKPNVIYTMSMNDVLSTLNSLKVIVYEKIIFTLIALSLYVWGNDYASWLKEEQNSFKNYKKFG